jgi:hypothetical protein
MDRRQPSSPFWTPKTHGAFSGRHHLAVPMFATPLLRSSPSPACALAQARAFAQPLIASDEVCHERGAWTSGWSQGMKWSQETRAAARTAAVPVVVRSAVRYGNGASSAARRVRSYYRRYAPTGDLQWVVDRSPIARPGSAPAPGIFRGAQCRWVSRVFARRRLLLKRRATVLLAHLRIALIRRFVDQPRASAACDYPAHPPFLNELFSLACCTQGITRSRTLRQPDARVPKLGRGLPARKQWRW